MFGLRAEKVPKTDGYDRRTFATCFASGSTHARVRTT